MRKSLLQAVESDVPTPRQPTPGETVLGCIHQPNIRACHYYHLGSPGIRFTRPDNVSGTADWLLICDACFVKFGDGVIDALANKTFPIGCDMQWPKNVDVVYEKN